MKKIAIIYSDYYPEITGGLMQEFENRFLQSGHTVEFVKKEVFGVSEIPFALKEFVEFDAIAVFGCVLEGETYHHELINRYVYDKCYDFCFENNIVLGYAILNVRNLEQAKKRCLLNDEVNRGFEAYAAISKLIF
jgi:6,7-dimethyl-8-ribityllumazine synthase